MTESTPVRSLLICVLVVAITAAPILAQTSELEEARLAAEADAKRDVSGLRWFGAGCLFNVIGVGFAYLASSTPQTSRLLGKSGEYVAAYTDAYRKAVRSTRTRSAVVGCAVGTVAVTALSVWTTYRAATEAISCWEETLEPQFCLNP